MSVQQQCAWMIYKPCHVSHECLTSERPCRAAYGEAQLSDHTGRIMRPCNSMPCLEKTYRNLRTAPTADLA